jgi:hypothetical protein
MGAIQASQPRETGGKDAGIAAHSNMLPMSATGNVERYQGTIGS